MSYRYSDYDKISGGAVRRYLARLFLALCVIGVGVGYIGNQVSFLPWENFTLFFPGWGSLFLIVPPSISCSAIRGRGSGHCVWAAVR